MNESTGLLAREFLLRGRGQVHLLRQDDLFSLLRDSAVFTPSEFESTFDKV